MVKFRNVVAGVGLLAASTLVAGPAAAALQGYVTSSGLNLRAGPSTSYPVVVTMYGGDRVTIYGCLSGWSWCDISWQGYRGWAAGQYLQVVYHERRQPIMTYGSYVDVPFLTFRIGPYWRQHYSHRPFFRDINRYERRHDNGPPPNWNRPPKGPPKFDGPKGPPRHITAPSNEQPRKGERRNRPPFSMGEGGKGPSRQVIEPPKGPQFQKGDRGNRPPRMDGGFKGQPQFDRSQRGRGGDKCKPWQQNGACQ